MDRPRSEQNHRRRIGYVWAVVAGMIAMVVAPSPAPAQSSRDVKLLRPREVRRLSEPAREEYENGVKALDHVNPILAIKHFNQASKLSPEAIDLHFLTARLAHLRARMVFGSDESRSRDLAEDYYDIAEQALRRIEKIKDLTPLTERRLKTQLDMIVEEKKSLKMRDQQRKAIGDAFRKLYAKERYGDPEEEKKKEEERKKAIAKRAAERRSRPASAPARPPRRAPRRGSDSES